MLWLISAVGKCNFLLGYFKRAAQGTDLSMPCDPMEADVSGQQIHKTGYEAVFGTGDHSNYSVQSSFSVQKHHDRGRSLPSITHKSDHVRVLLTLPILCIWPGHLETSLLSAPLAL